MQKKQKDQRAKIALRKRKIKIESVKRRQMLNFEKKLIIIMLALSKKNLPKIKLRRNYKELGDPEYIQVVQKIHTMGDPDVTDPAYTDAAFKLLIDPYVATYQKFKAKPQGAQRSDVDVKRHIVEVAYGKIIGSIEDVCNDVASAAGDVAAGESVGTRCGAEINERGVKPPKYFKAIPGIGCVDISTPSAGRSADYLRQYGIVVKENDIPTTCSEIVVSQEADIHIGNLKRYTMYAIREAYILPVRRTNKTPSSVISTERFATPTVATKAHKPVFTDGETNYVWGPWIYFTTK